MKHLIVRLKILSSFLAVGIFFFALFFGIHLYRAKHRLVIGAKNCAEQHILGELIAQIIERDTDYKVSRQFNLEGTTICFNALRSHTIDVYVEYTGTAILDILKEPIRKGPVLDYLRDVFEKKYGLLWLKPLGFSNQYTLIARKDSPYQKISDLTDHPKAKIAFDPEFAARQEVDLLKSHYPISWKTSLMDQVLLYFSLGSGAVDVISGFSTDGKLSDGTFISLIDDQDSLPKYEAAPLVSKKALEKFPQLLPLLTGLAGRISEEDIALLNYKIECERRNVDKIVREYIQKARI